MLFSVSNKFDKKFVDFTFNVVSVTNAFKLQRKCLQTFKIEGLPLRKKNLAQK